MTDPILFVCGFGRCGSSLLMQMLYMGGVDCGGKWPMFEDPRSTRDISETAWLDEYHGRALKMLDPLDNMPPELAGRINARAIWLDRDPLQQAKSYVKWQRTQLRDRLARAGVTVTRKDIGRQRHYLKQRRAPALARLRRICGEPLILRFEDILKRPKDAARKIYYFAEWLPLDMTQMSRAVAERGNKCLPYLLEEALIKHGPRKKSE